MVAKGLGDAVPTAVKYASAARLFFGLASELAPDQLAEWVRIMRQFNISGDGFRPSPEATLGIKLEDVSGIGAVLPSSMSGVKDGAHCSFIFRSPVDLTGLFFGNGAVRRATLLFRSVPVDPTGFGGNVKRLREHVPPAVRADFCSDFLNPLAEAIVPGPERDTPYLHRELVLTASLAEIAETLRANGGVYGQGALSPGMIASLVGSSWNGTACGKPLAGSPENLLRQVAPFNPQPGVEVYEGSNRKFRFFWVVPNMTQDDLNRLLELDVDILLHLLVVGDDLKAEVMVRARENAGQSRRSATIFEQLRNCCQVVRAIVGENNVVKASNAFQPGSPAQTSFDWFPVGNASLLVNGLTATLSNPSPGGGIFLGMSGGAPYFIPMPDARRGGLQHSLLVGPGSWGKSFWAWMLAFQMAGTNIVNFSCLPADGEAAPYFCRRWGPAEQTANLEAYEIQGGKIRQGLHRVCTDQVREWVAFFETEPGRDLMTIFEEEVVPAAKRFLDRVRLQDLPLTFRPAPGCNQALLAGLYTLLWTGKDPLGNDRLKGLERMWLEGAKRNQHCAVVVHDHQHLPLPHQEDPKDLAAAFGQSFRKAIGDIAGGGHKLGIHAFVTLLSRGEAELFGGLGRFHLLFEACEAERGHHFWLWDTRRQAAVTLLNVTVYDQRLLGLLGRQDMLE
ncbi:MAG: hypothetical protein Q8N84_03820 [bacterium]|nr:hypothetical protein [bacterium]